MLITDVIIGEQVRFSDKVDEFKIRFNDYKTIVMNEWNN